MEAFWAKAAPAQAKAITVSPIQIFLIMMFLPVRED
jgi:hypothetical protein